MSIPLMNAAWKTKVSNSSCKIVLVKLADHANDEGKCWPSYAHLARACEMTERSVIRHVKTLIKMNVIIKTTRKMDNNRNRSNVYFLNIKGIPSKKGCNENSYAVRDAVRDFSSESRTAEMDKNEQKTNDQNGAFNHDKNDTLGVTEDHPEGVSVSPESQDESSINTKHSPTTASVLFDAIENLWSIYPTHRRGGAVSFLKKIVAQEKLSEFDLTKAVAFIGNSKKHNKDWETNSQARFIPGIRKFIEERSWLVQKNTNKSTTWNIKHNESNAPKAKYFKPNKPVNNAPNIGLEHLSLLKKQLSMA